jgi:hypothetical protein
MLLTGSVPYMPRSSASFTNINEFQENPLFGVIPLITMSRKEAVNKQLTRSNKI